MNNNQEKKRYYSNGDNAMYWRYKKKEPPVDEFADKNGAIITRKLPHPFKCSKCAHIAETRKLLDQHWSEEH